MRQLYTTFLYFTTPFILLRLWIKSRLNPAYRQRVAERFGYIPMIKNKKVIWIHAVSLGESIAASPLIEKIIDSYPQITILVTTTTPTGSEEIQKRFGQKVIHSYMPYDLPHVLRRFLKRTHPTQVILMETEIWPNLLAMLQKQQIPVLIANARLSERSLKNYWRIRRFLRPLLSSVKISAQSEADAERFHQIGAKKKNIRITGNIKFDYPLPEKTIQQGLQLKKHWQLRPTLIAASTHEGEETIILSAFKKIQEKFPNALLILVPRHPERFAKVASLCQSNHFNVAFRSKNEIPNEKTAIYLGDTMGELKLLYTASDVAFVGGSLVPIGGHNLIEPASLSLPILSGPNLQNFIAIRDILEDAEALIIADDAHSIAYQVTRFFEQENRRHQFGARALSISEQNRGAIKRNLELLSCK